MSEGRPVRPDFISPARLPPLTFLAPLLRAPASRPHWRVGWLLGVVGLMLVLGLRLSEAQAAPMLPSAHASSLGIGTPGLAERDPLRRLALDLAEHLPADVAGVPTEAPLALHPPFVPDGASAMDEHQGAELSATPQSLAALSAPARHVQPQRGIRFVSTEVRRQERPPSTTALQRP